MKTCSNTETCPAFKCPYEAELQSGKMVCDFGLGSTETECPTEVFNQCQGDVPPALRADPVQFNDAKLDAMFNLGLI